MYRNIGKLIKIVAEITVIVLSFICVCIGLYLILSENSSPAVRLKGILEIVLGPIFSWVSCMVLYGFGELIEKVCSIETTLHKTEKKQNTPTVPSDGDRLEKLVFVEENAEDETLYNPLNDENSAE